MGERAFFFIPLLIFLAIGSMARHFRRSRLLLERWADRNGYRILHSQYRNFLRGPFFWNSSRGQTIYRVTVEDKSGDVRSGWVRCGGWWFGLLSDHVEARWDEAPPKGDAGLRDRWLDG